MAYKTESSMSGGPEKKNGGAAKKPTGLRLPATVPMDTLNTLPPVPEKFPATLVLTGSGSAAAAPAAAQGSGGTVSGGSPGGGNTAQTVSPSTAGAVSSVEPLRFEAPQKDEDALRRYEEALSALEALQGKAPQYDSRYDEQIQSLYEQITGRQPFRYDSATDPLYQQYVQDYTTQGKMAMRDTVGRAASLTGGYGSSYGQSVGQQQYDAYLQRLADVLPSTYGMALDAYKAAGDELQQRFDTTTALEKSDYGRYLDELGQYNLALERAQEDADRARSQMLDDEDRAYERAEDDYARRLAEQRDAYARLLKLIAAGYSPSAQELALAGLSSAQGAALVAQAASSSRSGGGGGSSGKKKKSAAKGDLDKSDGKGGISGARKGR